MRRRLSRQASVPAAVTAVDTGLRCL